MSEISEAGFPEYLWGAPVRQAFRALRRGFSLATALHADGLEAAFDVITRANEVPDQDAGRLELMVYIRSIGDWRAPARRVVEAVYEVEQVVQGRPRARLLHRWLQSEDRFEQVAPAVRVGSTSGALTRHLREFDGLAS